METIETKKFTPALSADKLVWRSSSASVLLTQPKSKEAKEKGELAETTKKIAIEMFIRAKYGREPEQIKSKYLAKGNAREEDSITLLSRVNKKLYLKNATRLYNEYLTGEPDLFLGESITNADETIDTKSSWSLHTFKDSVVNGISDANEYQGHSYMALTGAKKHTVAFCLVNGTVEAINNAKFYLAREMGVIDTSTKDNASFVEKCRQIEINHIFDMAAFQNENPHFDFDNDLSEWDYDIPMSDRLHTYTFERDEAKIQAIYAGVIKARNFINKELFKIA